MSSCELNLVLMSNNDGVLGIAVTVRSALNHCSGRCNVFVLSSNILAKNKEKLRKSWDMPNIGQIEFIEIDYQLIKNFRPLLHLHHKETYLRFYVGDLLPQTLSKCMVLDLDFVVTDDLCQIGQVDLKDNIIAAALDISASQKHAQDYRRQFLNLKHPEHYFNGGLLIIDLDKWRANDIGQKLAQHALENYDYTWAADQDPLNVILENQWLKLEQRWNSSQWVPETKLDHRGIIHLIGASKPWHADYNWKFKQHFFEVLDETEWKGWRPAKMLGLAVLWRKMYHKTPTFEIITRKLRKQFKRNHKPMKDGVEEGN